MRGSAELTRLADLFRIGAKTARQIGRFRFGDGASIDSLARDVEALADRLDAIVASANCEPPDGGANANNMQ